MKVLFAVSNESVSEAVIKRYPKEYRELLSYKNVYYFNAILKEIQNDKSYDRIVISEDLEPFVNTNNDSIDNFIFEHLDKISDEAQGMNGKEMDIILICSERRTLGSSILNKLFSIGIYNALIGNDRNMTELCKLINRPRTKKEAKIYYRIDQATYDPASDTGEVSEGEIQNILNHFKKLGKNTERYTDSFNNIAAQYTDDQLKLIINVLPMKVKAVLEAESDKYQTLMGTVGTSNKKDASELVESGIKVNTIGKGPSVSGPIVIPSSVKRNFTNRNQTPTTVATKPISNMQHVVQSSKSNVQNRPAVNQKPQNVSARPVTNQVAQNSGTRPAVNQVAQNTGARPAVNQVAQNGGSRSVVNQVSQNGGSRPVVNQVAQNSGSRPAVNQAAQNAGTRPAINQTSQNAGSRSVVNQTSQNTGARPTENSAVQENKNNPISQNTANKRYTGTISQVKRTIGLAKAKVSNVQAQNINNTSVSEDFSKLLNDMGNGTSSEENDLLQKRGRGRPRKIMPEDAVPKAKGKRGRPRKNPESDENDLNMLNDLLNPDDSETEEIDDGFIPGVEETEDVLPGMEEIEDNTIPEADDAEDFLPGMEEIEDNTIPEADDAEDFLPGMEDIEDNSTPEVDDAEDFLPGMEDIEDNTIPEADDAEDFLPGMEEIDDNSSPEIDDTEDVLPGMEDVDDNTTSGVDDDDEGEEVDVDSLLAGLNDDTPAPSNNTKNDDFEIKLDDDVLPGIDDALDDDSSNLAAQTNTSNTSNDEWLPNFEDDNETVLPGMGFEDEPSVESKEKPNFETPHQSNEVESIKPKIDYSTSNLNSLLSKDKKIVVFLGTTKNGTSFLINNLALMFSLQGINTAILDMTQNRNSYYLFTDSREELRNIAYTSISKLENGYAEGIKFNKNLTVYTALPGDGNVHENADAILSTLVQNHSLVLIDSDFTTPPAYFASSQEIYLVQSMDILTIQPLTSFVRDLKFKGAWEPEKARVVINKETPVRILNNRMIIEGMSRYNGPDMSVMTDLFNKDMVKACSIPFDEKVYSKYLEITATCKLSLTGYPKQFLRRLTTLGEMVYPRLNSKKTYDPTSGVVNTTMNSGNGFSNSTNSTLDKMKSKF